jgi:hypothetical protein
MLAGPGLYEPGLQASQIGSVQMALLTAVAALALFSEN